MSEASAEVRVTLNGEWHQLPAGSTIEFLLLRAGLVPHEVATALNGSFVPREQRRWQVLRDGDAVVCLQPIVGG